MEGLNSDNAETENPQNNQSSFQEFDQMDEKVKIEDMDIGSFICDCCNKRFASAIDVQTHENQPQKLLFCCGLCNLYFIDSKNAEIHSKIHVVESDLDLDG